MVQLRIITLKENVNGNVVLPIIIYLFICNVQTSCNTSIMYMYYLLK